MSMSGPARGLVRIACSLCFILGVGGFIATSMRFVALERGLAAAPCHDPRDGGCWREVDGTVAKSDCGHDTCRVTVALPDASTSSRRAEILVARDPGSQLHEGQ